MTGGCSSARTEMFPLENALYESTMKNAVFRVTDDGRLLISGSPGPEPGGGLALTVEDAMGDGMAVEITIT